MRSVRRGESLVEIIAAIAVLASVLPSLVSAFSSSLAAEERLRRFDSLRYGVQWWTNRLGANIDDLDAMPRALPDGSVSFEWITSDETRRAELHVRADGQTEPYTLIIEF